MSFRVLQAAVIAASVAVCGAPAWAQSGAGATQVSAEADPVVARVNGSVIRRSDVVAAHRMLPQQYRSMPLETIYTALLRQLVDRKLIVGEARKAGLDKDPAVRKQVAVVEMQILEQAYLRRVVVARITDQAVRERYEEFAKTQTGEVQVRASHILVKTKAEADAVVAELGKPGADFAALARTRSTGPSRTKGGDLGYFSHGMMVKPFADAAFALRPGQYTRTPVQTRFGWHVIKVEDRRQKGKPSFEESAPRLRNELIQQELKSHIAGLREGARVEQFNLDGSSASVPPSGGIRRVP